MVVLKKGCIKDAAKCKLQRAYAVCRPWRSHCTDAGLTEGRKCCTRVTNWPPTYNRGGIYLDKKNKKQAPMGIPVEQADLECICSYSFFGTNSISSFQLYSPKEKVFLFGGVWGTSNNKNITIQGITSILNRIAACQQQAKTSQKRSKLLKTLSKDARL